MLLAIDDDVTTRSVGKAGPGLVDQPIVRLAHRQKMPLPRAPISVAWAEVIGPQGRCATATGGAGTYVAVQAAFLIEILLAPPPSDGEIDCPAEMDDCM